MIYFLFSYTITFNCMRYFPPISFTVESISDIRFPKVPSKQHYTAAWSITEQDVQLENTVVSAVYTPIEYVITFEGAENVAPMQFNVENLRTVSFPPVPEKKGYKGEWNLKAEDLQLENTTVTAVYTKLKDSEEERKPSNVGCDAVINTMTILFPLSILSLLLFKYKN